MTLAPLTLRDPSTVAMMAVYQPLVAADRVFGAEALVRAVGPDGQPRSAQEVFARGVSDAQASSVVLSSALAARAAVPAMSGCVSVNLPAEMFASADVREAVVRFMDLAHLPRHALMVELLETSTLGAETAEQFRAWSTLGILTAVDDFPTGFATHDMVLAAQPDVLKLSGAVLGHPERDRHVGDAVTLARESGAVLVAEGVETVDETLALRALGVGVFQGFYFARPEPSLQTAIATARPLPQLRRISPPAAQVPSMSR